MPGFVVFFAFSLAIFAKDTGTMCEAVVHSVFALPFNTRIKEASWLSLVSKLYSNQKASFFNFLDEKPEVEVYPAFPSAHYELSLAGWLQIAHRCCNVLQSSGLALLLRASQRRARGR